MKKVADKLGHVGTGLSFACLVHCLAFPFLVTVLPIIGLGFMLTGTAEKVTLTIACSLTAMSLARGFRSHRSIRGFCLLLCAVLYYWMAVNDSRKHLFYLIIGGVALAYANLENRYLLKTCKGCANHNHPAESSENARAVLESASRDTGF